MTLTSSKLAKPFGLSRNSISLTLTGAYPENT